MKTSVLVNNYNYERYVCDAVRSTLEQTRLPDEVIVVDDGSSDSSLSRLRAEFGTEERVRIVSQENGGQLSAFNNGYAHVTGHLVFLLDADDLYQAEHVESTFEFFRAHPECDFLISAYQCFGDEDKRVTRYPEDRDLGYSVIDTLYLRSWIGGPTSTLCIRKSILDLFMPIPFESEWRVRADDCLVWGASIAGAHKFYTNNATTRYRVHDNNAWFRKAYSGLYAYRRILRAAALIRLLGQQQGYEREELLDALALEFASSRHRRTPRELRRYRKIVNRSGRPWRWRRKMRRKLRRIMDSESPSCP